MLDDDNPMNRSQTYVLVQCGAPEPDATILATQHGIDLSTDVDFVIPVLITSDALKYSSILSFFEVLGELSTVQATLGSSFATSPCFDDLLDQGRVVEMDNNLAPSDETYVNS